MLSLEDHEHTLCPECGMPMRDCHDPMNVGRWEAKASVCWVTAKREAESRRWADANPDLAERYGTTPLTVRVQEITE